MRGERERLVSLASRVASGAFFLASLWFMACGGGGPASAPTAPTPTPESTITITGTVVDALNGAPIPGVSIRLNGAAAALVSDGEGHFAGTTLRSREIIIHLIHAQYVDRSSGPPNTLS